jgi:superfamily II DNA or RNA helicase
MLIELHNVRAKVLDASEAEHLWLGDYLSWADDKAWVRRWKGYGKSAADTVRLYDRVDDTYPAGFTSMLVKAAIDHGFAVRVEDARIKPHSAVLPLPPGLRDYQAETCATGLRRTRGVVWAATGAGKTQIAMGWVESTPVRWLFLVNQTQLGLQARDRYRSFCGQEAGVIAEGEWRPDRAPHGLTVATFQSLYAKLKHPASTPEYQLAAQFLAGIQGLIVDECHVLPADSFRKVLDYTPEAYYRLGLSATPLSRGDRKAMHLIGCLGSVIHRIPARTLIEAGILAKPVIRFKTHHQVSDRATWQGAYNEIIAKGKPRNQLVCRLAELAAKPCVVFVKDLDQGQWLTRALTKAGHAVEYVDGKTPTKQRQAMVTRLERGDTDILVASVVMNQGIDVPQLRSVVIAAGGSSTIAALQRVGRGMRRVPGKDTVEVWDIKDTGNKWLERHTRERMASYETEDYEYEVLR